MSDPRYEFDFMTVATGGVVVPSGITGLAFYDTGTQSNGQSVFSDVAGAYAKWTSTSKGVIFSAVSDVGNEGVTDYFEIKTYPDSVEIIGAGEGGIDGVCDYVGLFNGRPRFFKHDGTPIPTYGTYISWTGSSQLIELVGGAVISLYTNPSTDYLPSKTNWVDDEGTPPAPTLEYTDPSGSAFVGQGAYSGTFETSENILSNAWYRAETAVFDSLLSFVGGEEGNTAFRGFLPVQGDGDDLKFVNVWQLSSGGSGAFDMSRLAGGDAAWCSLRSDMELESIWKTREEAMQFAGAVLLWLQQTNNLHDVENVDWCSLAEIPPEPEIYRTAGTNRQRYWRQTVKLELVYATA